MNRLGALSLALAAFVCALSAQGGPSPAGSVQAKPSALSAEQAVGKLEMALKAVHTLEAKFDQLYYSMSVSEPLHEKGDLFLERPDLMRWNYKTPQEKVFLYKSGVLEMYLPEDKQLTRTPVSKEALESDIFGIFLGTASFKDAYTIEDTRFPTEAARVRQVKLVPKTEGDFAHVLLEIDETTWLLRRAIFLEWAGNKREFDFSQVRTDVRISAKTFTLKVPPGTEIIDDTDGIKR
jgi:outer membrane lipoprotein carrier protein